MTGLDHNVRHEWDSSWRGLKSIVEYPSVAWDLMDNDKRDHLLSRLGNKRGILLEVGCGAANLSARLADSGFTTVCLDSSTAALEMAKETYRDRGQKWRLGVAADAYHLPYNDDVFDGVLSTGLLEHFQDPIPLIKEMARVVKPGGFVYADILPKKKLRLLLLFDFIRPLLGRHTEPLFEMSFRRENILKFAVESGLKDIEVFSAGIYWPRWPILRNNKLLVGLENFMCRTTHPLFKLFDRTKIADILGIYYFVFGRK
jgi:ubiquinone/menaquinone biosynthesis C-methylase UbiE